MHFSHKLLWIFLGIVVLVMGSVFLYSFYSKSPVSTTIQSENLQATTTNPTADWKIYRNEKYGFEIKYPPYFRVAENTDQEGLDFIDFEIPKLDQSDTESSPMVILRIIVLTNKQKQREDKLRLLSGNQSKVYTWENKDHTLYVRLSVEEGITISQKKDLQVVINSFKFTQ